MRPYSVEFLLIISPICFALLWNEFFSYFYYSLRWPKPRYEDSTKILLIADPQLLGYQNEPFGVGLFTLWDSDRFVSKGFEWASNHASPNHVIFLGDLFDEGVSSTEDEYDKTLYRFYNIFTEQSLKEKTVIYIPGDNDIGGEGEPVLPHLKNRFSRTFMNKFTNFSLGYCFSEINMFDFDHSAHFLNKNNCTIHILLSHVPIIQFYNHPNVRAMNPSIILSAHDHSAIVHNLTSTGVISTRLNYLQSFYYTKLLNHTGMLEIQVPTCSYRMGTFETGVSHIELRKSINGSIELYFDVFWLPCRFYHLALYVCFMAGYQYVQLDQIPYQGTVNAYGIAVDIDPTNDRVKIRDEVGEALLIGRIQNLIKDLKIGDIVRLHRVKAIPTNYLEYALGRFGNSIVVWDPNSESLEVPKYKDSVTFTLNHEDKRRVEQLKKIKFRQPKSNDELQACLKTSITRKIISQVACIPFELDENCSMEIREALASVNANQTKTLTCLENIDETYLQGKQYFNFIAVVAEIYRTSQTTFVRVFDGTISPVSSKLLKYHGGDHIAVKRLPGGVTERTNEYLLDVACYGEHAKSANELTLGDFAVFTNAHVYAKQHGDKMICLHDGEIFRRTVATVNVECSLVTTLTNRCRSVVDELFTMSQSQSTQYTCNSSEVSTQNSDNAQVLRTTFTPECRKRKADEGKNHDDSNDKKNRILSSGTPSVAPRKSVQFRIPIENEAPPIPMHQLPKKTTSECSTSNASDHHELPNLTSLNNSQPEASSDELRLHVTTTPCSILKKRSIKSIERTMVHEVSSSQDREENLDSHNATSPNAQTLDTDIFNNDAQNHISLVDSSSESSLKKKYTPTFYEACEVYSFYKNVKEMMKEVFSERINPPHFSLNEEIQIIQGLEGDSSCMMENFMEVNSVLFLDRMFLSNCVIFTGNCNVCFNEVRLKRRQNAFCPNCLKKNKKSTRFHIGLRMLFPINSSFLVGISREQVMKYEQSPCLDTDKVTHAFHIDNEEEYEQYASDLILLASSIAHRYKIRAGYGRVVPKRNPHGPTVVFIEECSLEEKFP